MQLETDSLVSLDDEFSFEPTPNVSNLYFEMLLITVT